MFDWLQDVLCSSLCADVVFIVTRMSERPRINGLSKYRTKDKTVYGAGFGTNEPHIKYNV